MPRIRWRPGLRPGPRWGSSRRSLRPPSRLGRGTPPPQEPHLPRRLWPSILAPLALTARRLVSTVYPPTFFSNTPLVITHQNSNPQPQTDSGTPGNHYTHIQLQAKVTVSRAQPADQLMPLSAVEMNFIRKCSILKIYHSNNSIKDQQLKTLP